MGDNTEINLPDWAKQLRKLYVCGVANQFVVSGNIYDKLLTGTELHNIDEFMLSTLFGPFDVVLTYDIGNGIQCIKGNGHFNPKGESMPTPPRLAIETITQFLRYTSNNLRANQTATCKQVAVIIRDAQLVVPSPNGQTFEMNAIASLIRDWGTREEFINNGFVSIILSENVNDLHPLLINNDRAGRVVVPLPTESDLTEYLTFADKSILYKVALDGFKPEELGAQLVGAPLTEVDNLLRQRTFAKTPLNKADVVKLKKQIIEKSSDGLIEFIESDKTLDDVVGQDEAKKAIRQHILMWKRNNIRAIPMGYLFAAPVGVGKTFLVECIAGEAGVPVVRVKNFRTKWVGDTESKQEKIIRLIRALGRCFVFFDEADATLGKRDSDTDGGLSARVYSAWAQEMSNTKNRGKIVWLLATSRADLIEIDLKRPGRIDVAIPLFPAGTPQDGFALLQGLSKREEIALTDNMFDAILKLIPQWLTAGAAEAIVKKVYMERNIEENPPSVLNVFTSVLTDYQPTVPLSKLEEQIKIAANNCTDTDFIPAPFKRFRDN